MLSSLTMFGVECGLRWLRPVSSTWLLHRPPTSAETVLPSFDDDRNVYRLLGGFTRNDRAARLGRFRITGA
jgi:hypothetical protein